MKRAVGGLSVLAFVALFLQAGTAAATGPAPAPSPCASPVAGGSPSPSPSASPTLSPAPSPAPSPAASPSPSPSASSAPAPSAAPSAAAGLPCPTPDPNQALYDRLRTRVGADVARTLTAQQQLSASLDAAAAKEAAWSAQVADEENLIADLTDRISQLDDQIAQTQGRIDDERVQVKGLALALYRQPDSWLLVLARTGNLRDALQAAADLVIAGERAHAVQVRLEADLAKLATTRAARQAENDRASAIRDDLTSKVAVLDDLLSQQADTSSQLDDLVSRMRDLLSGLTGQPPDVQAGLLSLLEQVQRDLIAKSATQAWSEAIAGASRVPGYTMSYITGSTNLHLSLPIQGAQLTQPFGPTGFWFEPALGRFPHFHSGIDLAAAEGTPVTAAADGVVLTVGHTTTGYGTYVIVGHRGAATLYAHLDSTTVKPGEKIQRGQRLGFEGSTGYSTGPHLHFEVRVNGQPVDPMAYFTETPPGATNLAA